VDGDAGAVIAAAACGDISLLTGGEKGGGHGLWALSRIPLSRRDDH
jgi:hypothetical protein